MKTDFKWSTEILAGVTTFFTMSYIIFVNPHILAMAGMNADAVFVATCLVSALGSFLVGALASYPIAIAPGIAINTYFAFVAVKTLGFSWQQALGAVVVSGIIFFILTITKIRRYILESIPQSLTFALAAGIGLFIALIALKNANIITTDQNHMFILKNLASIHTLLFAIGFIAIIILDYFKIPGAILISILSITIIANLFGLNQYHGIFSLPPSIKPTLFQFDIRNIFDHRFLSVTFAFLIIALFDSTGTFLGLIQRTGLAKDPQRLKRISNSLVADSIATIAGGLLGTSSTSPFIESASGIRAGGTTGITAITVAILFLCALFLSPLASTIPSYATAPALLFVACLMMNSFMEITWADLNESIPSALTAIMIPYTSSIADGIGIGIISYVVINLLCGKWKLLNITLLLLAMIFLAFFLVKI